MLERFLRYVRIDTQGAYRVTERPSTEKQLELSRLLLDELRELGLEAELTHGSAVFSGLPGSNGAPVVGLIAHVDTTPDVSGAGVSPYVKFSSTVRSVATARISQCAGAPSRPARPISCA